jgi:tetratricopeptide (TPR) repeat protein
MSRIGDVIASVLKSPQTLDDYYLMASMQIAQGRYDEAMVSVDKCLAVAGNDTALLDDLWTKKGCLYAMSGDYDRTLSSFAKVSDGGASSADITQIMAQIYIERGDLKSAAERIAAYLKNAPDDADMQALIAQVCYLEGDYEQAEAHYTVLLGLVDDADGQYHLMRASCREQLEQFEGALADYAQAAQLGFSDKGLCWAQAALCAYQLGLSEDVLSYGEQAAQTGSDQASWDLVYEAMGVSALQLTQYDASVSYFNKALEANAALVDAYYYRGVAYMALQQYDAAAQDFGASIERGERTTDCYFNRALCELQIGHNDAAKADLETVLTLSDDATLVAAAQAILNEI